MTCDITETSLTPSIRKPMLPPRDLLHRLQDLMNEEETGLAVAHLGQEGSRTSYKSLECFTNVFVVRRSWRQVQSFTEGIHHSSGDREKENRAKVSQRSNNISK